MGLTSFFIKGESYIEANYFSRYSWRSPASHELVAMQEHFVNASKDSPLPSAYPETFNPDVWQTPFREMCMGDFHGPVIALADGCSWEPKGPLKVLADELPHVKEFFERRTPAGPNSPFCLEECMDTLGTFSKLTSKNLGLPDVFLVFNTLLHLASTDRVSELKEAREIAPPELSEKLTKNNYQERHFHALVALESLLDSWNPTRPSDHIYVLTHVVPKDRGKEKLLTLLHQLA